ncbi:MAG: ABC transporter permease [Candidatus Solibacter usitatus]|nr:ABC transporter permease [Candidatus Solibacter usitatus]
MKIPLAYNLRNLLVRRGTTVMTALGIALTVAVLVTTMALAEGLNQLFSSSGNPRHILVMRKGSTAELTSLVTRAMFQDIKFKNGIARSKGSEPMVSLEFVTVVNLPAVDNPEGNNVTLRGISPTGLEMREGMKLESGRWFQQGRTEIVVGKSVAQRYPGAKVGAKLRLGRSMWEVAGVVDAGTSSSNSEMFGDLNQVASDYDRGETASAILVRAQDEVALAALINDLGADRKLNVVAQAETDYFASQTSTGNVLRYLGLLVSVIMAVGSAFAAMNTMYAAVARRTKEIGTLRVLGFSRRSILSSFLLESLFLALLGGLMGVALVLPINGFTTGITSMTTFSEVAFSLRITPKVIATGMAFAALMGALGGLFPAGNAARKQILSALREG